MTHSTRATINHIDPTLMRVNVGLAIAAVGLLLYYVVQVNLLAGLTWQMRSANDHLSTINDQRNVLVAQQSALEDRQALTTLAQQQGLVPAGAITYLVQEHSVAAR